MNLPTQLVEPKLAPIILFVYNRLWHTQQTISALQKNELAGQSDLIIYSDASQSDQACMSEGMRSQVQEVRDYIRTVDGFKSVRIVEREKNWGLAANIIDGVTEVVFQYGKVVVMEDDLVTSPFFLRYMNDALLAYEQNHEVGCIHGYIYPIKGLQCDFFIKGADCWGWATWSRAWQVFEADGRKLLQQVQSNPVYANDRFNIKCGYIQMLKDQVAGKNNSWAVRWYFSGLMNNMYCLYPAVSYVNNIGLDNSGTHCDATDKFSVVLKSTYDFRKVPVEENLVYKKRVMRFCSKSNSRLRRLFLKAKRVFSK